MIKLIISLLLVLSMGSEAYALEITAPQVPESGQLLMPENTESFADGLMELLQNVMLRIRPDLKEASQVIVSLFSVVIIVCILRLFSESRSKTVELAGGVSIAVILLTNTNSMISLGTQTVQEMSDYGRLFFPVMTTALAAQGGVSSSTAIYAGTVFFDSILGRLIVKILVPFIYFFLALAVSNSALQEDVLKKFRDSIKDFTAWSLKIILTIYTTYMSITGVVSGTTDAAALKATKVTISSAVPVVGGILSDASEAILVSAGLLKNAAGIYGVLAMLAIFLEPFLKIGIHYIMLKLTASACSIFGSRNMTDLIEDFSSAMGLLLAMTGAACLILLISTVCFMKGVG